MKTWAPVRSILLIAALITVVVEVGAQVPVPRDENESFWNNPEAVKNLHLSNQQRQTMNELLKQTHEQFLLGIRSRLRPEQWKQMLSLRAAHSGVAAEMGLEGPDAQRVASALKVERATAQNYVTLINRTLSDAVSTGTMLLAEIRLTTNDPCKTASEAVIAAAPNLDSTQLKLTFTLDGTSYAGNTCPAGLANLRQGQPAMVAATYPCAVTSQGVNLAPDCKFSVASSEYAY